MSGAEGGLPGVEIRDLSVLLDTCDAVYGVVGVGLVLGSSGGVMISGGGFGENSQST